MSRISRTGRLDATADDPERIFRRPPRVFARWSLTTLWRRVRMPARRRRWLRENVAALAPFAKAKAPVGSGPALAIGDFSGVSGLSRAALYELERLRREHPDLEVIDGGARRRCGPKIVHQGGPEIGTLYLLSPPDSYARHLAAIDPARVARARRVGLWVWETPIFPADWHFALDLVHEIWTPSEYSRAAIQRAAGQIPVRLRPHSVTRPARVEPFDRASLEIPEDAFLGLAIMDLCSCPARKNPWAHVAAWQAAFGDDPSRVLVMKMRVSKRTRCVLHEVAEMVGDARNIRVVVREMEAAEIASLQSAADVYLSLHRAEGYGLNIRESLEAGVEVVATHFSANAEYGPTFANYHPLPYTPTRYRDWTGHYPDGRFDWAEVDLAAASAKLRELSHAWEARRAGPDRGPARASSTSGG